MAKINMGAICAVRGRKPRGVRGLCRQAVPGRERGGGWAGGAVWKARTHLGGAGVAGPIWKCRELSKQTAEPADNVLGWEAQGCHGNWPQCDAMPPPRGLAGCGLGFSNALELAWSPKPPARQREATALSGLPPRRGAQPGGCCWPRGRQRRGSSWCCRPGRAGEAAPSVASLTQGANGYGGMDNPGGEDRRQASAAQTAAAACVR